MGSAPGKRYPNGWPQFLVLISRKKNSPQMPRKHGEKDAVKNNPRMLRNHMRTFMTAHPLMRAQFILMAPILEKCFRCHTFVRGVNTMEIYPLTA